MSQLIRHADTHTCCIHIHSLVFSTCTHTQTHTLNRITHVWVHRKHIFCNTHSQTQTSRLFFFFSTDESKIHSHFHFLEGEMALLNTAWFGDLSLPPFPLLVSLTNTSLHTSVSLSHCHSLVLTLFLPASVQFPLSLGTVYSLFTSSHPVFKLRLGVCVCVWDRDRECVSLLLAHFLNKGHSCCWFAE